VAEVVGGGQAHLEGQHPDEVHRPDAAPQTMVSTGYNPALVALSLAIAVLASYTALDLGGRVRAAASGLVPNLVGCRYVLAPRAPSGRLYEPRRREPGTARLPETRLSYRAGASDAIVPKVVTEASGLQAFSDLKRWRHFPGHRVGHDLSGGPR
jgi:hypothetical protein